VLHLTCKEVSHRARAHHNLSCILHNFHYVVKGEGPKLLVGSSHVLLKHPLQRLGGPNTTWWKSSHCGRLGASPCWRWHWPKTEASSHLPACKAVHLKTPPLRAWLYRACAPPVTPAAHVKSVSKAGTQWSYTKMKLFSSVFVSRQIDYA
jgi:hypothetical protein